MADPTPEEVREHMRGLLFSVADQVARLSGLLGAIAKDLDVDASVIVGEGLAIRQRTQELEQGVCRGRLNRQVRTAPGAVVIPAAPPIQQQTAPAPPRKPIKEVRPDDYDTGPAPNLMELAKGKR